MMYLYLYFCVKGSASSELQRSIENFAAVESAPVFINFSWRLSVSYLGNLNLRKKINFEKN